MGSMKEKSQLDLIAATQRRRGNIKEAIRKSIRRLGRQVLNKLSCYDAMAILLLFMLMLIVERIL
jgi:hypothetical protein